MASYALDNALDPLLIILLAVCVIGLVITGVASGPTKLERAIKVLDISKNSGMLILQIRNRRYAEELVMLNPTSAKIIRTADPLFKY